MAADNRLARITGRQLPVTALAPGAAERAALLRGWEDERCRSRITACYHEGACVWTHWSSGPLARATGGRIRGWAVSAGRARDSRGTGRSTRARAALQAAQPPHRATFVTRQACGAGIVLRRTAVADRSHDAPGPTGIQPIPRRGCYHWRVGRDADERLIIQRRGVSPRRREPKSRVDAPAGRKDEPRQRSYQATRFVRARTQPAT